MFSAFTFCRSAEAAAAYSAVHTFNATSDGTNPVRYAPLLYASDSNLYGVTTSTGTNGNGTVYKLTTSGVETTLHSFTNSTDGYNPDASLLQGKDGYLYGVTTAGSTYGNGAVYKVKTDGTGFTVIHVFNNNAGEGYNAVQTLAQASDGYLYGATSQGGANGYGAIFKLSTDGSKFTILQPVQSAINAAAVEPFIPVGTTLYGYGYQGGPNNGGSLYSINTDGSGYGLLYAFGGSNAAVGTNPNAILLDTDDNLYLTPAYGGANNDGSLVRYIISSKSVSLRYSFPSDGSEGAVPTSGLAHDSNGNLYVTTYNGGANGSGAFVKLTTGGTPTLLHSFPAGNNYQTAAAVPGASGGVLHHGLPRRTL